MILSQRTDKHFSMITNSTGKKHAIASVFTCKWCRSTCYGKHKTKKPRVTSADRTEKETHELLEAWAPKFSKLRGVSQRKKIKIWNDVVDIYSSYKERCPESQRMLQQVKKRQHNLEYEFKQFKQRSRSTGEDGIQKIKEGFPYFNILSKERRESTTLDWHAEFFYWNVWKENRATQDLNDQLKCSVTHRAGKWHKQTP